MYVCYQSSCKLLKAEENLFVRWIREIHILHKNVRDYFTKFYIIFHPHIPL